MNRRQFLICSAVSFPIVSRAYSERIELLCPIVDTHQHLWDLSKFRLPWLRPGGELARSFLQADYKKATKGLGIEKAVYMEVAVAREQKLAEAEYIIEVCADKSNPTCAAVIGGLILEDGFEEYVKRFEGNPYIKGVRHPLNNARQLEDSRLIRNLRLLGRLGMSFDLVIPPRIIGQAADLVERCGDTRFILDHCGNADPLAFDRGLDWGRQPQHDTESWKRDIETLSGRPNVICKISGIIARVPKGEATARVLAPIIDHCLDTFGPDRVVFASDWPVCTRGAPLRVWVRLLREIVRKRSFEDQRKLFWNNANNFYGLA
ncbi:MAG: amidohydrolase family protein [Phycisphaerales bacterium]|nr:MAG: amidohydrolase family protein [Phycisphaerales bacterium]